MAKLVEYFDRLPMEKIDALRALLGGELSWKNNFSGWSKFTQLQVGKIVFDRQVKKVTLQFERNQSTGYEIPIIIGEIK